MIPALLSCLFVIYLYQSLNQTNESPTSESTRDDDRSMKQSSETSATLSERLERIQQRLEELAKRGES